MQLYNALSKEQQFKSDAQGLDYMRMIKESYRKLNHSVLKRQKYNLVKEISEKFVFNDIAKMHIPNYKTMASIYMLFEYEETDNPNQLMECKTAILQTGLIAGKNAPKKDELIEAYQSQPKDVRLLAYKLLVDKFNEKYSVLDQSQKQLLNKYITNVNDTTALKRYVEQVIPHIKTQLLQQSKLVSDKVTKIKVQKLSEMLCTVENMKTIKESHILSLLRYYDLIKELKGLHQ